jgi:hypothetical protein
MKRKRKQRDPRQLPLPSDQEDTSSELVECSVDIPPPFSAQPELIRLLQRILCVKAPVQSCETPPEPNPDFFHWPTTNAPVGLGKIVNADWPDRGLLRYFGYAVGQKGKSISYRKAILSRVFELDALPTIVSSAYMADWGDRCSSARLKKMAYSIATFCRNAKRKRFAWMRHAIENYEDDLAWLKVSYYDGRFDHRFRWPTTK